MEGCVFFKSMEELNPEIIQNLASARDLKLTEESILSLLLRPMTHINLIFYSLNVLLKDIFF